MSDEQQAAPASRPVIERLLPGPKNAGLRVDGYFVWCGSVIKAKGEFHIFVIDGQYHMVLEDNQGKLTGHERHGGHFVSDDGIHWRPNDPPKVYTHTLHWDDCSTTEADRRERPELFNANAERKGNGHPTHLVTAVQVGDETWCTIQPIAPR